MPKTEVGAKAAGLNHRHGMTDATPIIFRKPRYALLTIAELAGWPKFI